MIELTINGKVLQLKNPINLMNFLEDNSIEPRMIVIEYNGEIIKPEYWNNTTLKSGDKLEIVHMVAGG